jgi:hypothetical protein
VVWNNSNGNLKDSYSSAYAACVLCEVAGFLLGIATTDVTWSSPSPEALKSRGLMGEERILMGDEIETAQSMAGDENLGGNESDWIMSLSDSSSSDDRNSIMQFPRLLAESSTVRCANSSTTCMDLKFCFQMLLPAITILAFLLVILQKGPQTRNLRFKTNIQNITDIQNERYHII